MEIKSVQFKKEYENNRLNVRVGDVLVSSLDIRILDLNDKQIMIIMQGLRYDINKKDVQITYK